MPNQRAEQDGVSGDDHGHANQHVDWCTDSLQHRPPLECSDQPALMPIPSPWRPRRLGHPKAHWSRWQGQTVSCDDCVLERANGTTDMDLLRAIYRYEYRGIVRLVCSVHAARRWKR